MKKNLWLAALVGVAFTSCVNDESSPFERQTKELTFAAPVMKTQSRANVLGEIDETSYPTNEDFKVYCWNYEGNFEGWNNTSNLTSYFDANGDVAKHGYSTDGNSKYWTTTNIHYWPDPQYKLIFAAYSPADFTPKTKNGSGEFVEAAGSVSVDATVSYGETGLNIANFRVQDKSDLQYDLMYSDRNYDRTEANNGSTSVKLQFNHALSSIVFSAQKATDVDYQITDIKIGGSFIMDGDFSQNISGSVSAGIYSETSNPTWSETAVPEIFDDEFDPNFDPFDVPSTNPAQFTKGTSALLLIPQDVPADAYVIVSYTITNHGVSVPYTTPEIKLSSFKFIDVNDSNLEKSIEKWEAGKRYIYRISFGANKQIYFEPSVTDWVDHPTAVYTIG